MFESGLMPTPCKFLVGPPCSKFSWVGIGPLSKILAVNWIVPVTFVNPQFVSAMQYSMRWLDKAECVKDEMIVFNKYLGKGVSHKFL